MTNKKFFLVVMILLLLSACSTSQFKKKIANLNYDTAYNSFYPYDFGSNFYIFDDVYFTQKTSNNIIEIDYFSKEEPNVFTYSFFFDTITNMVYLTDHNVEIIATFDNSAAQQPIDFIISYYELEDNYLNSNVLLDFCKQAVAVSTKIEKINQANMDYYI